MKLYPPTSVNLLICFYQINGLFKASDKGNYNLWSLSVIYLWNQSTWCVFGKLYWETDTLSILWLLHWLLVSLGLCSECWFSTIKHLNHIRDCLIVLDFVGGIWTLRKSLQKSQERLYFWCSSRHSKPYFLKGLWVLQDNIGGHLLCIRFNWFK